MHAESCMCARRCTQACCLFMNTPGLFQGPKEAQGFEQILDVALTSEADGVMTRDKTKGISSGLLPSLQQLGSRAAQQAVQVLQSRSDRGKLAAPSFGGWCSCAKSDKHRLVTPPCAHRTVKSVAPQLTHSISTCIVHTQLGPDFDFKKCVNQWKDERINACMNVHIPGILQVQHRRL